MGSIEEPFNHQGIRRVGKKSLLFEAGRISSGLSSRGEGFVERVGDLVIPAYDSTYRREDAEKKNRVDARRAQRTISIVIVEPHVFMQECIVRSLRTAFAAVVSACSSVENLLSRMTEFHPSIVILSVINQTEDAVTRDLSMIAAADANIRTIVLAHKDDFDAALGALRHGAQGYIPMTTGFDIAMEAMRFIIAGGLYLPAECVVASKSPAPSARQTAASGGVTDRELTVIRAIRQGKPNKIIAYELNLCESTVKVHVRHIMKKLLAKNRTDLAIKSADLLGRFGS